MVLILLLLRQIQNLVIHIIHIISNKILEFFLRLWWGKPKACKRPSNKYQARIIRKSAVELAQLIRERKLTSCEVVSAFFDRIIEVNPEINAVLDGPFEEAIQEALIIDERLANNHVTVDEFNHKPFLGVPFTTKDSNAVAGKLHTLGMYTRRNVVALEDADVVRLMKDAGAIIIATSNLPMLNLWVETRNVIKGRTNNPYDLRRSAGGSSGGEASLISSCCSAFGLGTDIGGSIRIPSYNCGIFGHKPTMNAVSLHGCTMRSHEKPDNTLVCAGPMSRYATDLLPLLKVIADPEIAPKLQLDKPVDLKKLRYFYMPNNRIKACNPICKDAKKVMKMVLDHFKDVTGEEVNEIELPFVNQTHKLWLYWMSQEPKSYEDYIGKDAPFYHLVLALKQILAPTIQTIYNFICDIYPKAKKKWGEEELRDATKRCQDALKAILGDNGILFFHSSPRTAPYHYYPIFKYYDFTYFSIFNVLQVPATQVPISKDKMGLPLGIQVVSTKYNDRLCLAVAEELEDKFGGWLPPFKKK